MKPSKALLLLPALAALAPALGANDILRSNVLVTNGSRQPWHLETASASASFTVAVNSENGPLVSSSQTLRARTSYRIAPGQTVLVRLQDARKGVSATFNLRDHHQQVSPVPCLSYRFESNSPGFFARCFSCCCSVEAPGPATLAVAELDGKAGIESCLESTSPQQVRIVGDQWPEFRKVLDSLMDKVTVGPSF